MVSAENQIACACQPMRTRAFENPQTQGAGPRYPCCSGIPCSAAADWARRKMASGISRVVFMRPASHIYGSCSSLARGRYCPKNPLETRH